jgi:BlaI family transcriptional regulator, penicillinase repressor
MEEPTPLSDAQLEIMQVIWDRGEATVAEVWRAIADRRPLARNTVLTTITRLEEKGWLRHYSAGNTFVYQAVHARQTALSRMALKLIDAAFEGSAAGLVMTLLEGGRLSPGEAERIRAMLDEAKSAGPKGRRKKP